MRIIFALVVFFSLVACSENHEPDIIEEVIRPARLFQVQSHSSSEIYEFVGRIEALQTVDVSFEVSGPLKHLPILEGQTIVKGGLLAALDSTDFLLAVREQEVQLSLSQRDFVRKRKLLVNRGISKAEVDDAKALYDLNEVRLAKAKEALADTKIYAPFDAYVAKRYIDNHINITPADKIARIMDLHELIVRVSIPESIFIKLSRGNLVKANASFSFLSNQKFPLQLRENGGEANAIAQTYEVAFSMPRPQEWNLLPGMTAKVLVEIGFEYLKNSIRVPASALVGGTDDEFFVWVFDPLTGYVDKRWVEVGNVVGRGIPITSGLSEGEIVVVAGASQLREGLRVRKLGDLLTDLE